MNEKIIALYSAGMPARAIAAQVGVSHTQVIRLLAKAGIERRPAGRQKMEGDRRQRYEAKRRADPEKWAARSDYIRRRNIEKNYAISDETLQAAIIAQDGLCAICQRSCTAGRRLAIDHCHISGRVRGLLCSRCNTGLGLFRESPPLLLAAVAYLNSQSDLRTTNK